MAVIASQLVSAWNLLVCVCENCSLILHQCMNFALFPDKEFLLTDCYQAVKKSAIILFLKGSLTREFRL
jgi:hypothetical protein